MDGNKIELFHIDAIVDSKLTSEELDEKIKRLTEESNKLTEWPKM